MLEKLTSFNGPLSCQSLTIRYFYKQIEQQQRILRHVQAVLPPALAKQTRHCLIKNKKLLVYTDSAIWATQLRFYSTVILAGIAPLHHEPVETIQIKIITQTTGPGLQVVHRAKIPSAATIAIIRNDSLAIADGPLKEALLKLSSTLDRLSAKN